MCERFILTHSISTTRIERLSQRVKFMAFLKEKL